MFLVTGASSGIGHGTAAAFGQRGIDVLAVARRLEPLRALADTYGPHVHTLAADLSTPDGLHDLIEATAAFSRIDGVVHAAGSLIPVAPYAELTGSELTSHFDVHVVAPIEINNRLGDRLHGARVLHIDSFSASALRVGWSQYSILKAAAQMAARAAAEELQDTRIVRVFPGGVRTELVEAVLESSSQSPAVEAFREFDRAGELNEPADVGRFIARIALDATDEALDQHESWDYGDPTAHNLLEARDM